VGGGLSCSPFKETTMASKDKGKREKKKPKADKKK
jgi:hypothetical protein